MTDWFWFWLNSAITVILVLLFVVHIYRVLHRPASTRPEPEPEPEPDDAGLTPEQAKALLEEVESASPWPGLVDGEKKSRFDQKRCQHCGGLHVRKCPAVAEIEFHADGKVKRVVYFPHGTWPADEVLWLEDVVQAAAETDDEE